jgi:hypothetical protein
MNGTSPPKPQALIGSEQEFAHAYNVIVPRYGITEDAPIRSLALKHHIHQVCMELWRSRAGSCCIFTRRPQLFSHCGFAVEWGVFFCYLFVFS